MEDRLVYKKSSNAAKEKYGAQVNHAFAQVKGEFRTGDDCIRAIMEHVFEGNSATCKYCKNPIDPKRLEARPASSSCVTCKKTLTQEL